MSHNLLVTEIKIFLNLIDNVRERAMSYNPNMFLNI